nr:unnamed protein product [Callosobruchus analis]
MSTECHSRNVTYVNNLSVSERKAFCGLNTLSVVFKPTKGETKSLGLRSGHQVRQNSCCSISEVVKHFIQNWNVNYICSASKIVHEMLVPSRVKCRFRVHMYEEHTFKI